MIEQNNAFTNQYGEQLLLLFRGKKQKPVVKKIRPDIIIHKRGTKNNIGVIEVKKKGTTKEYEVAKLYDLIKLYALTTQEPYLYIFGLYIELPNSINEIKDRRIIESTTLNELFPGQKGVYDVVFTKKDVQIKNNL